MKYISLFSGIGGFEVGIQNSKYGKDFECIGYSEIDKYALSIYEKHFPEHKYLGDVTKIDTKDLPDFDLLVGGFPCFTGETLITTIDGLKPIKKLKKGDYVLTHTNQFKPILNVMVKPYNNKGYKLTFNGTTIKCTPEHPFYTHNPKTNKNKFVEIKNLTINDLFYIPKHNHNNIIKEIFANDLVYEYEDKNGVYFKIDNIEEILINENVYNIEVEDDNSYTTNGIAVHNCQAFSIAGKRKGFDDTRGTLFFEIARILKDKRPRYFLLENVKGLLSHDKGETFKTILKVLSDLGYTTEWWVINSKNHGVPQSRERIYIAGHIRGKCSRKILCPTGDSRKDTSEEINVYGYTRPSKTQSTLVYDTDGVIGSLCGNNKSQPKIRENINGEISKEYWGVRTGKVHHSNNIMGTLTSSGQNSGGRQIIIEKSNNQTINYNYSLEDIIALRDILIKSKKDNGVSIEKISETLGISKSDVEQWFYEGDCWVVPSADIWFKLKELLKIDTNRFDEFITEFEIVNDIYDGSNVNESDKLIKVGNLRPSGHSEGNVYLDKGIVSTITRSNAPFIATDETINNDNSLKLIGNITPSGHSKGNVYATKGLSPTIMADNHPTNIIISNELEWVDEDTKKVIEENFSEVDEDRLMTTTKDGVALCLTQTRPTRSVSKKLTNYVLEKEKHNPNDNDVKPIVVGNTTLCKHASGNVFSPKGISRTLMAGNYKAPITIIEPENDNNTRNINIKQGNNNSEGKTIVVDEVIGSTQKNAAYTKGTYSPCLTGAMGTGGGNVPMVKYKEDKQDIACPVLNPDISVAQQNGRRIKENGEPSFTLTTSYKQGVYDGFHIRRLTPVECERLQAFPVVTSEVEIWLSDQVRKNVQSVAERWHKNLKLVGNAEKDKLLKNVSFVEKNLKQKNQQTKKLVLQNVLINYEAKQIQLYNLKKSKSSARTVEKENLYLHQTVTENFVPLIVGMNTIVERIIHFGKEELLQNEQWEIHQENGKIVVKLYGKEMMPLVNSVEEDLIIMKNLMKFITSDLSNMKIQDMMLITLYCCVIGVIIGCIPIKTDLSCLEKINLKITTGWTEYGKDGEAISDTQRYKCCGNAVTTSVISFLIDSIFNPCEDDYMLLSNNYNGSLGDNSFQSTLFQF